jgi:hypothetical protein
MKALSVRVAARGGSTTSPLLSNRKGKKKRNK